MAKTMNRPTVKMIIQLSSAQKRWARKASYLLKGLLFLPFLVRTLDGKTMQDQSMPVSSQAGDDIYPLF